MEKIYKIVKRERKNVVRFSNKDGSKMEKKKQDKLVLVKFYNCA